MPRVRLTLEYEGTDFVGWQRQLNGRSVQEVLEKALAELLGAPVSTAAAGRTDAGVHALGQVASATLDLELAASAVQRALNMRLPPDIRVLGVVDAKNLIEPLQVSIRTRASELCLQFKFCDFLFSDSESPGSLLN